MSAQSRGVLPPRTDDHVLGRVLWRNLALSRELAWMSPHDLLISRWNNDGGLFFLNLDLRGDLLINQLIFYAVLTSKEKQKN